MLNELQAWKKLHECLGHTCPVYTHRFIVNGLACAGLCKGLDQLQYNLDHISNDVRMRMQRRMEIVPFIPRELNGGYSAYRWLIGDLEGRRLFCEKVIAELECKGAECADRA